MDLKPLFKEWRVWLLIIFLAVSVVGLGPNMTQEDTGEVNLVFENLEDNKGIDFRGGSRLLLSIDAENITQEQAQNVADILTLRVNRIGLADPEIRTVRIGDSFNIQVTVADQNQTQLRQLISQEGQFEARMPITISDTRNFTLTDYSYQFERSENGEIDVYRQEEQENVRINDEPYRMSDRFQIENYQFIYLNNSSSSSRLEVVAYSGEDVQDVITSDSIVQGGQTGGYSARFPVVLSQEAAQRSQTIYQNYGTTFAGEETYLSEDTGTAQLRFYVDGNEESALNVAASFRTGQPVTQPSITTGGETETEARESMQRLQVLLQSGQLPYPVEIETISTLSSSLGDEFMVTSVISIIGALIAVGLLIFVRYQKPEVAIPIVITGSSEVLILMGLWFTTFGTLSLSAIAGIIAAVGTGVDDQIIITDESGRDSILSWTDRMKKAFFVIFTSAASTIGAMTPLITPEFASIMVGAAGVGLIGYTLYTKGTNPHYVAVGGLAVGVSVFAQLMNPSAAALQSVHGFAITTIIGIMIGISITRPAYAKMLEHLTD